MEADLRSEYHGLDLRDYYKPRGGPSRLTSRLLLCLITQLPSSSRTRTAVLDADPLERWDAAEYLMADLKDAIRMLTVVTAMHGSGKRPQPPQPSPRPTDNLRALRARQEAAQARRSGQAPEWWDELVASAMQQPELWTNGDPDDPDPTPPEE